MPIRRCPRTATAGRSCSASGCAGTSAKTSAWRPAWRATTTSTVRTAPRRRPREGARRDLPQGDRSRADGRARDRDLGRRRADAQLHVHRRLPAGHRSADPDSDIVEPINIGSDELVTINQLVDIVEEIAGVKLKRALQPRRARRACAAATATTRSSARAGLGALDPAGATAWNRPTAGSTTR